MQSLLPEFRLRRLAEDIAQFTPDLAEILCRNGISDLPSDEIRRFPWLETTFPPDGDSGSLIA
jgi:hypothetical protein